MKTEIAKKASHTAGPWRLSTDSPFYVMCGTGDESTCVAEVKMRLGRHHLDYHHQDAANARLIAAAPELLAAVLMAERELRLLGSPKSALTTLQEAIKVANL